MTEEDAFRLRCPFADAAHHIFSGELRFCIASRCAVWRWIDGAPDKPGFVLVDGPNGAITVRKPTAAHYGWPVLKDLDERHGFCGAGGMP